MIIRCLFIVTFLGISVSEVFSQKVQNSWIPTAGYEANYSGNNIFLRGLYITSTKHNLMVGLSYNYSDGFSNNPVVGIDLGYGYTVVENDNWQSTIGVDYRRQKPISNINVQTICLSQTLSFHIAENWIAQSKIGYGIAVERNASAGQFSQFNNLTGLFSLGCGYIL